MVSDIIERQSKEKEIEAQVDNLRDLIEKRFPAEAASTDMSDRYKVIQLAADLLDRLWRWEH